MNNLRPVKLSEIIGQGKAKAKLAILIAGARSRNEPIEHILIDGPAGLGKTTFATCLANEMRSKCILGNGSSIKSPRDLVQYLIDLTPEAIFFIDEIHRLSAATSELLYTAMEDFRIEIIVDKTPMSISLPKFTLIGATTEPGKLSMPFKTRFVNRLTLDFYSIEDLTKLLLQNATRLGIYFAEDPVKICTTIAKRSRGTPRIANNNLKWVRDFASQRSVTYNLTMEALDINGLDENGLTETDRKYLRILKTGFQNRPAGINAIAAALNIAVSTLTDDIEPYLLRMGFINRTPKGRMLCV